MTLSKRSSHPSLAERAAIDFDRVKNYQDKRYRIACDGSLRDSRGRFVNGTKTIGGFNYHPENRRKTGGWDKRMTASYQYRRYWNMEKQDFIALGKRYRVIPLDILDNPTSYPYEDHTIVEEITFKMIMRSQYSLSCMRDIINRVEGYPKRAISH